VAVSDRIRTSLDPLIFANSIPSHYDVAKTVSGWSADVITVQVTTPASPPTVLIPVAASSAPAPIAIPASIPFLPAVAVPIPIPILPGLRGDTPRDAAGEDASSQHDGYALDLGHESLQWRN
jgi:hypothetical protein